MRRMFATREVYATFAMALTDLTAVLPFLRGWLHPDHGTLSWMPLARESGNTGR